MPRKPGIPSLRRHKPSSQGVVTLNGKDHYLGKWPADQKDAPPEVRAAYDRLIAEWLAQGRRLPSTTSAEPGQQGKGPTGSELLAAFWTHAEQHYRDPDGEPTSELEAYRLSLRPLRHLYADLPAAEFSPLKLKAVRELMVNGSDHPEYGHQASLARKVVNQRVGRIVRAFKWGVAEEMVPASVHQALIALKGLQKGRSRARELQPADGASHEGSPAPEPPATPSLDRKQASQAARETLGDMGL